MARMEHGNAKAVAEAGRKIWPGALWSETSEFRRALASPADYLREKIKMV